MIITFCIIALNEEKTLPRLLDNLLQQSYTHKNIEVLFVDGMSNDCTYEIMNEFKMKNEKDFYSIQIFQNEKKTLPSGWNIALANYKGEAIVRVDAHAEIPENFIERNVYHLQQGDMVCGGYRPNIIDDDTKWNRMLLAAETSLFGSSISDFRRDGQDRKVHSIFHGCYKREVFDTVGQFNERLVRTEDNDINYRIREAGFDIWFRSDIISYEHIRSSLSKMIKQKYANGYWIGKTLFINPKCLSLYYFVPFVFVLGIIFTSILCMFGHTFLAKMMWSFYVLFCFVNMLMTYKNDSNRNMYYLLLPIVFFLLHVSYGIGTLFGMINMVSNKD